MDISTIVGIVIGFVLMIWGIGLGSIGNFIDKQSAIIVIGGTMAALIASYPFSILKQIPKHFKIMLDEKRFDPVTCIETLVEYADIARKNGLLALEDKANELTDPFFRFAVQSMMDFSDGDKLKAVLTEQLENLAERHEYSIGIYERGSSLSPAFGMIGTLIGLINMLKSLNLSDGGASTLGESMSIALITTFYGVVVANLIFGSIAKKLSRRNDEECRYKQIILEGVLAIQSGETPKFLREKLYALIEEKKKQPMSQTQAVQNEQVRGERKKKAA
ncbi:MAG: motility protein A [Oscillibacter sp.]|nr:motility protein A [Oscillibacter sp.]